MKTDESSPPHDELDPSIRRLLELDEELAHPSTARAADTRAPDGSIATFPDSPAEQCLQWIEAIRLTSPELMADAFAAVAGEKTATREPANHGGLGSPEQVDAGTTRIGRFRLLKQLGKGGYGVVFLAHDPNLNRQVALKVPRPEVLITGDLGRRFLREAEAAAALDHPQIVPVYEAGTAGPICYIASAFCDGMALSQWLERRGGKVAPQLAARMTETLAGAVQHAHDRGILHRDIKPGNILMEAPQDATDEAAVKGIRLTDFGLARIEQDASDQTVSTAIIGTPAYMAPEQAASRREEIGVATDVYALGATLYHLLTGRPPIVGASQVETLAAITQVDPVEPARFQPDLPRDLNAICLKCLEKEPARRYATASALQADLQRFLRGETVVAHPVGPSQRLMKWCRRNPGLAALTATSVIAVLATLVTAAVGWWLTSAALATAEQRNRETKEAVDKYFVAISDNQLLAAPGLKPLRQELLGNALDYYQRFLDQHRDDAKLSDDLRATHVRIGEIHEELGDYRAARSAFDQALELVERNRVDDPDDPSTLFMQGMILRKLAQLDRHSGQLPEAMARIDEAIEIHRGLAEASYEVAKNDEQLGLLLSNKASAVQLQGDIPQAEQLFRESEEIFERLALQQPDEPRWRFLFAQSQGNRSIMQRHMGQVAESQALLEEALQVYRGLVEDDPADPAYQLNLGKALANWSTYSSMSGEFETSLDRLREATDVFDRLALVHPQAVIYHVLRASTRKEAGMLLTELQRFADAETMLMESREIVESTLEINPEDQRHRDLQHEISFQLGRVYFRLRNDDRALRFLDEAIASYTQSGHRDLQSRATLANCLEVKARVLTRQGRPEEALAVLKRGRALLDELRLELPESNDVRKQLVANFVATADALELQERYAEALQRRQEVVQLEEEGIRNRRILEHATTLARTGDVDQAESMLAAAAAPTHPDEWLILARAHAVVAAQLNPATDSFREHRQKARQALQQAETEGLKWSESEYPPTHQDWSGVSRQEE